MGVRKLWGVSWKTKVNYVPILSFADNLDETCYFWGDECQMFLANYSCVSAKSLSIPN